MLPIPKYKNHMRVDYACSRERHGKIMVNNIVEVIFNIIAQCIRAFTK